MNHPVGPRRVPKPSKRRRIDGVIGEALKSVGPGIFEPLLFPKSLYDQPARLLPFIMKTRRVAGCFPVSMGQAHRVTERVYFPFTLAKLGTWRRLVVNTPGTSFSAETKCIGISVDQDAERLAVDDTGDQIF